MRPLFLPGGGRFYLGDHKTDSMYLLTEPGLFLAGNQMRDKLENEKENIFYLHTLKLHELGIFTTYRQARLRVNSLSYRNPIGDTPVSKLALKQSQRNHPALPIDLDIPHHLQLIGSIQGNL